MGPYGFGFSKKKSKKNFTDCVPLKSYNRFTTKQSMGLEFWPKSNLIAKYHFLLNGLMRQNRFIDTSLREQSISAALLCSYNRSTFGSGSDPGPHTGGK